MVEYSYINIQHNYTTTIITPLRPLYPCSRLSYPDIVYLYNHNNNNNNPTTEAPPFIPVVNDAADTSNFEDIEQLKPKTKLNTTLKKSEFTCRDLPFIGFTYNKNPILDRLEEWLQMIVVRCVDYQLLFNKKNLNTCIYMYMMH